MRFFALIVSALSLFAFSGVAYAYYDNSIVIEIGNNPENYSASSSNNSDTGGADTINPNTGDLGPSDTGSGAGGSNDSGGSVNFTGGSSGGSTSDSGGGTTGTTNGSGSSSGSGNNDQGTVAGSVLFSDLTGSGAITEDGGGSQNDSGQHTSEMQSSSTASESPSGNGTSSASLGAGNTLGNTSNGGTSVGGGGSITINASKVRQALLGNLNLQDILDQQASRVRSGYYGTSFTNQEIGLVAASTEVGDSNIDQISFGATRFEIVYRSQGFLFAIIPISFPVDVKINPQATSPDTPVSITLPWYHFFVRRLFDTNALAQQIDAVITTNGAPLQGETADQVKLRLFDQISLLLKKEIGTQGTPTQQSY